MPTRTRLALALAVTIVVAAGCGSDTNDSLPPSPTASASTSAATTAAPPGTGAGTTIDDEVGLPVIEALDVPADYPTIQAAVDEARPGDLVLIAPGVYREAVTVQTDDLTIRGVERETVILDGDFTLDNGIFVSADRVAVENMTARNYTVNGFYWTEVEGYRGSYLTAIRNGDYGVYAFDSTKGQFDNSYASGSPDAGFYIGQCFPCDAVLDNVIAEHNGLGYSGTNAGGNLVIANSVFRNNRVGVVPNSGSYELCYPQRDNVIVGNLVYDNNQGDTPAIDVARLAQGNGILAAGGVDNVIERNRVYDHDRTGIALVPFPEEEARDDEPSQDEWDTTCAEQRTQPLADELPSLLLWDSWDNRVVGNDVSGSGLADIAVASVSTDLETLRNCFGDNVHDVSAPAELESLAPCDGAEPTEANWKAGTLDVGSWLAEQETMPESVDYQEAPLPLPPQLDNMPDAATAPPHPATDVPMEIDVDAIEIPERP